MDNKTSQFVTKEQLTSQSNLKPETLNTSENAISVDDLNLDLNLDDEVVTSIASDLNLDLDLSLPDFDDKPFSVELLDVTNKSNDLNRLKTLINRAKIYLNDSPGTFNTKLNKIIGKTTVKKFMKLMDEFSPNVSNIQESFKSNNLDDKDLKDQSSFDEMGYEFDYQESSQVLDREILNVKQRFCGLLKIITEDAVSKWVELSVEDKDIVNSFINELEMSDIFQNMIPNITVFLFKLENIIREFIDEVKRVYKDYNNSTSYTPLNLVIQASENLETIRVMDIEYISYDLKNSSEQTVTCPSCGKVHKFQTLLFTKSLGTLKKKADNNFKFGHIPFLCEECGQVSALPESTLQKINEHLIKRYFRKDSQYIDNSNDDLLVVPESSFLETIPEIRLINNTIEFDLHKSQEIYDSDIKYYLQELEKYSITQNYTEILESGNWSLCENILKANIRAFTPFKDITQATYAYLMSLPIIRDILDLLNLRDNLVVQEIYLNQIIKNYKFFKEQSDTIESDKKFKEYITFKMEVFKDVYIPKSFTFLESKDVDEIIAKAEISMQMYSNKVNDIDASIAAAFKFVRENIYSFLFNSTTYSTNLNEVLDFSKSRFFSLFDSEESLTKFLQEAASALTMQLYTENFLNRDLVRANSLRRINLGKDESIDNVMKILENRRFLFFNNIKEAFNPLTNVPLFSYYFKFSNLDIFGLYSKKASLSKALLSKAIANISLNNNILHTFYYYNLIANTIRLIEHNSDNRLLNELNKALDAFFARYPQLKCSFNKVDEKDYLKYVTYREAGFSESEAESLLEVKDVHILKRHDGESITEYKKRIQSSNSEVEFKINCLNYESAELSTVRELLRLIYLWVDTIHENKFNKSPFFILSLKIKAILKYRWSSESIMFLYDKISLKTNDLVIEKPTKLSKLLEFKHTIKLLCDLKFPELDETKEDLIANDELSLMFLLNPEQAESYMFVSLTKEFDYTEQTKEFLAYAAYLELWSLGSTDEFPETNGMTAKDTFTYISYSCLFNEDYLSKSAIINAYPEIQNYFKDFNDEFTDFKNYLQQKYNLGVI